MSTSTKTYDVFISFRGEDTRRGFTNHLYSALDIKTYIDNNLAKGGEVWPTLSKAIEGSHIAIVVFSENYASSKWYLEELVKMLQCRKDERHGQVVIHVFYEVDPSHIRKQTGSYGEAFSKHERVLEENGDNESIQKKVPQWKAALTKAANISGWDSRNYESLVTVSALKTFADMIRGREKYISFQNCINLDESSLHSIMEGAQLSIMIQNVIVRRCGVNHRSYDFNIVKVCWPGSTVPAQFTYRTTQSSIPIKLPSCSHVLGIVLCAVISPSLAIKKHGAKISCQCYLYGRKVGYATRWYRKSIRESNCDHVYMWYDSLHFDSTVTSYEQYLSFEFYVTDDLGEHVHDVLNICTKECGVHLIFDSDLNSFIRDLNLDLGSKRSLALNLEAELGIKLGPEPWLELESQHGATLTTTQISNENDTIA